MKELPFELFVALRYLSARRKQTFISLISLISTIGVAVGVMALLITLSLMTGLQLELRDRLVGSVAHAYVGKAGGLGPAEEEVERLLTVPHVVGAAPTVQGPGLATVADTTKFMMIKGIDPALEKTVTNVAKSMVSGSLDALATPSPGSLPGVVVGKELATGLGLSLGDSIEVMTPEGMTLSPFGMQPRRFGLKVVGIFNLGFYEYDSAFGFVKLDVGQKMLDRSRPDYIELKVDELFRARDVAADIPKVLGPEYSAQDWSDLNASLFDALWLEKMAMSITIGLIVMVAALNIIATLVLLVMEKTRDIAILKTMGTSSASIRRIFILQGLVIGLIGTFAGAIGGLSLIYVLDHFQLIQIPGDVYSVSHVPFRLQPLDFVVVIAAAVLICFLATIYPSRQAAKLDPAQALRYQ